MRACVVVGVCSASGEIQRSHDTRCLCCYCCQWCERGHDAPCPNGCNVDHLVPRAWLGWPALIQAGGDAYGKCPLGCGAVPGVVATDGDMAGLVRLAAHPFALKPALGRCIGGRSFVRPLPLAGPDQAPPGLPESRRVRTVKPPAVV